MDTLSFWAQLSTIVLVVETVILLLIPGVALYFAIRGMRWLLDRADPFFQKAQRRAAEVQKGTDRVCTRITEPILSIRTGPAWAKGVWRGLTQSGRSRRQYTETP